MTSTDTRDDRAGHDGPVAVPARPAADATTPVRNVFACLVHENPECVADLVRNLRHLDPDSTVLLYNGSREPNWLGRAFPSESSGAILHPTPRRMLWRRLHDFAIDCMRPAASVWAIDPHDGKLGTADRFITVAPSLSKLRA